MQEKEFAPVPGYYPLTVSRDGRFRNELTGKMYVATRVLNKSGRVSWIITVRRTNNKGAKTTTITVQRAWALCYLPREESASLRVVLRDNPVRLEDAIDPANVVWIRSYSSVEVNTVLDDGTEVMSVSAAARQIGAPLSTVREHLVTRGFSNAGTQPVYLM
jgi:hypothetical protein